MQYTIKLYGDEFFTQKIIRITFNIATLVSSIQFYNVKRMPDDFVEVPTEINLSEFFVVSDFIERLNIRFKLYTKKEKKQKYNIDEPHHDTLQLIGV